jgi:hypothetical protein
MTYLGESSIGLSTVALGEQSFTVAWWLESAERLALVFPNTIRVHLLLCSLAQDYVTQKSL